MTSDTIATLRVFSFSPPTCPPPSLAFLLLCLPHRRKNPANYRLLKQYAWLTLQDIDASKVFDVLGVLAVYTDWPSMTAGLNTLFHLHRDGVITIVREKSRWVSRPSPPTSRQHRTLVEHHVPLSLVSNTLCCCHLYIAPGHAPGCHVR